MRTSTWFRRLVRHDWWLLALLLFTPTTAAQKAESPRIVAVGDIHGDFDAFVTILKHAGVVDAAGRWSAGKTTLVQTGDYTDRGPQVRAAMDFLMALEPQANAAGGRVAVLLGNHEVMNLIGDVRDVTPAIYLTFADEQSEKLREAAYDAYVKWCTERASQFQRPPRIYQPVGKPEWMAAHPPGYIEYRSAFTPQGRYGRWLRTKQPLLQLNDIVFLHAGVNPDQAPRRLEEVNRQVLAEIKRWDAYQRRMLDRKMVLPHFTLTETLSAAQVEIELAAAMARRPADPEDRSALPVNDDPLGLKGLMGIDSWALGQPGRAAVVPGLCHVDVGLGRRAGESPQRPIQGGPLRRRPYDHGDQAYYTAFRRVGLSHRHGHAVEPFHRRPRIGAGNPGRTVHRYL